VKLTPTLCAVCGVRMFRTYNIVQNIGITRYCTSDVGCRRLARIQGAGAIAAGQAN
jgi:hypothetical protein